MRKITQVFTENIGLLFSLLTTTKSTPEQVTDANHQSKLHLKITITTTHSANSSTNHPNQSYHHKINTKLSYRLQSTIKTPRVNHHNYNNPVCINTYIQLYKAIPTTITSTKPVQTIQTQTTISNIQNTNPPSTTRQPQIYKPIPTKSKNYFSNSTS